MKEIRGFAAAVVVMVVLLMASVCSAEISGSEWMFVNGKDVHDVVLLHSGEVEDLPLLRWSQEDRIVRIYVPLGEKAGVMAITCILDDDERTMYGEALGNPVVFVRK